MTTALIGVLAGSVVVGVTLLAATLNTPRRTLARIALAGFLVHTVIWALLALVNVALDPADPTVIIAWTLPVVALMIASFRVLIRSVCNAAWTPSVWYLVGLFAHPLAMVFVAAIPAWHAALVTLDDDGSARYAAGFWVHSAVGYGLLTASIVALIAARKTLAVASERGLRWTLVSWLIPIGANFFTIVDQGARGVDLTPVGLTITAVLMGRTMIQDGLADLIPVARVEVFESLTDAVFVLDTSGRVIDCNTKGREILAREGFTGRFHGQLPRDISPGLRTMLSTDGERDLTVEGREIVVNVSRSDLRDRRARALGTLVHIRDITAEALRTRELIRVRDELAEGARLNEQLREELAEQVVRDVGTGLHNRRYVFDVLPDLVSDCEAKRQALAIVILDIDHFKAINDTYGHAAGDRALAAVASAMRTAAQDAIVARFGGEEFVVVFPSPTIEEAIGVAESIRAACAAARVPAREGAISITVSAGLAWCAPGGIDAARLIEDADDALYIAKNGGRDRLSVAGRDGR